MNAIAHRSLGHTGISVSEIGLGGWQLANPSWNTTSTKEALDVVKLALDLGCDFFDTAPGYGGGRSEELLGKALKPVRTRVTICTKFGHGVDGATNFDAAAIRPSLESSLRRLQTEYVDILLLHNPSVDLMNGSAPHYEELDRLKAEGKLRVYGVSLDHGHELEAVIKTTRCGAVEVLLNIFHQEPLAWFSRAADAGIGLIAKVPLDSGWLSGKYHRGSRFTDIRDRWSLEIIERRAALVERLTALVPPGTSVAHAALAYILAQPEISTVIPGTKSTEQARDNFAAAGTTLSAEVMHAIRAFWERELKNDPLPW